MNHSLVGTKKIETTAPVQALAEFYKVQLPCDHCRPDERFVLVSLHEAPCGGRRPRGGHCLARCLRPLFKWTTGAVKCSTLAVGALDHWPLLRMTNSQGMIGAFQRRAHSLSVDGLSTVGDHFYRQTCYGRLAQVFMLFRTLWGKGLFAFDTIKGERSCCRCCVVLRACIHGSFAQCFWEQHECRSQCV